MSRTVACTVQWQHAYSDTYSTRAVTCTVNVRCHLQCHCAVYVQCRGQRTYSVAASKSRATCTGRACSVRRPLSTAVHNSQFSPASSQARLGWELCFHVGALGLTRARGSRSARPARPGRFTRLVNQLLLRARGSRAEIRPPAPRDCCAEGFAMRAVSRRRRAFEGTGRARRSRHCMVKF